MSDFDMSLKGLEEIMNRAASIARTQQHGILLTEHLLVAAMKDKKGKELISALNGKGRQILEELTEHFETIEKDNPNGELPFVSPQVEIVATQTVTFAALNSKSDITAADVIYSMLKVLDEDSHVRYILNNAGITLDEVEGRLVKSGNKINLKKQDGEELSASEAENYLAQYCTLLNEVAENGKIDPLIGREEEVADLVHILARKTKNNPILVGPEGTGKTAIIEGLALKINRGEVPATLTDAKVWALDMGAMMAGTKYRGEMEERIVGIVKAVETVGNSILFIDEIHTIMGAGGSNEAMNMANLIKPALARGKLHCIGASTPSEIRKFLDSDRALKRRFEEIQIKEPSIEDTKRILHGLTPVYEEFHKVKFDEGTVDSCVDLAGRYISGKYFPDKAIDILDRAGARLRVKKEYPDQVPLITLEDIKKEVAKVAKLPAITVDVDENTKLAKLESNLKANVFDQDEACELLSDSVIMNRAGLREGNKPALVSLLVGQTGSGKTELAKTLAETLGVKLVRFDMSEYKHSTDIAKLIGSPPGYVGYGDGSAGNGLLVNEIEQNPHCVLLLDEVEKAHPDVFQTFLQVFDDARLTSSNGKTVDFSNVSVIMTSNLGTKEAGKEGLGFVPVNQDTKVDKAIKEFFAPELLNRLDAIVKFKNLQPETMHKIVRKFFAGVQKLASSQNVELHITEGAETWLATNGYDRNMGARPLSRLIADKIKKPLSKEMLFGNLKNGGNATVDVNDGKIIIRT